MRKTTRFQKGFVPWNKGIKQWANKKPPRLGMKDSVETRKKMSLSHIGKPNGRKGTTNSSHTRYLISISHKGKKYCLGHKRTKENKKNISLAMLGKNLGEKHWNWKGGISKVEKQCRLMPEYKQWRSDCFSRDGWTCKTCGNRGFVVVHHIVSWKTLISENNIKNIIDARNCKKLWELENGVTLCEECHSLTDNYKWKNWKRGDE